MPTALAMRSLRSAVLILEANLIWRRRRREGEEGGGGGRGRGRREGGEEGREGWLADTDTLHCTGCTEHDVDSKPCQL